MTKIQFIKNLKGINEGGDLPEEFLSNVYDRIAANEIKMESEDSSIWTKTEKKGWLTKRGGRIQTWKRRWFVCRY
jgi:cytohesin